MRRKITLQIVSVILLCGLFFLAGWRIMPRIWPAVKEAIVYPLLPELRPEEPEKTLYTPASPYTLSDEIEAQDSVVYYFYRPTCPYCEQLDLLIRALPDTVTLSDGTQSTVKIIPVNKSDETEGAWIQKYYEEHPAAAESPYVPAILIGDRYLSPVYLIVEQLMDALCAGEGTQTPLLDGAERKTE